jgi:hypothetical protein
MKAAAYPKEHWTSQIAVRATKNQTKILGLVRVRTMLNERPPAVGEISATFADRLCHVVSVTDPYGRNLGFVDRSRYIFFQIAPRLYSRG